jgi:hypothetical protein
MTWVHPRSVCGILVENHYLGAIDRGTAWQDEAGIIIVTAPTSRRIPASWLELARWCITNREKNSGSKQWARFVRALRKVRPDVTTIVSYSDPSVGHDGALYRACNWWWAPTWHRLRPPPSGNGAWGPDDAQSVKDRWIFPLAPDANREAVLLAKDDAILKRLPWAAYQEPGGADYRAFKAYQISTGGGVDGHAGQTQQVSTPSGYPVSRETVLQDWSRYQARPARPSQSGAVS